MASTPALHEHRAAALYDDECPLYQLGASWIEVGLSRVVDLTTLPAPAEIPLPAATRESSLLASAPRGSPIAG